MLTNSRRLSFTVILFLVVLSLQSFAGGTKKALLTDIDIYKPDNAF